eukprot:TRINITY_DN51052_c0_g1_i1.p1 TRINITY_DN51052_c0_g1~~TRINITY_DN51052_c0_g1_i1.p1  ORF type:complete len:284 (+),score=37.27 TRINITY_DN51052_c0_g1_i1:57-908(+)
MSALLSDGCDPSVGNNELVTKASTKNRNRAPPRPVHYVLRPEADPRIDKSIYVRYDPHLERKTGAIIIVVPGGNYDECDIYCGEGQPIALWLAEMGITAVVLQYRCVSQGHFWPAQFEDWALCAKAVYEQAASWECDRDRIGVIGFSAGGHLASYAALKAPTELLPKLQVLVYAAIDTNSPGEDGECDPWYADQGYPPVETSTHLLEGGQNAPPTFLVGITTDKYCPAKDNSDVYAEMLKRHGIPFEYVVHEDDEHGCGLKDWWTDGCSAWLQKLGWAAADPL